MDSFKDPLVRMEFFLGYVNGDKKNYFPLELENCYQKSFGILKVPSHSREDQRIVFDIESL